MAVGQPWYERAFAADYLRIYRHRDREEAQAAVDSLADLLVLPDSALALDLCCGAGRHLETLNGRGIHTVGLDLSEDLLTAGNELAVATGRLVRGDMRHLPFRAEVFDAVFSFFTSFGYFADDAENAAVITEIGRTLKYSGRFVLDYLNAPRVRATLVPEDARELGKDTLIQRRRIDPQLNTVEKTLILRGPAGERRWQERVKLYELADFERFCGTAGLRLTRVMGDAFGAPYGPQSDRLVLIGERCAD